MADLLLGQVLWFEGDPFLHDGTAAARHGTARVLIEAGRIAARGPADDAARRPIRRPASPTMGDALISAGFVDAHVHYPQTAIIASWGKRLIDWLNTYTFPEEMRFADPAYAAEIAERYLDLTLAHGTTTVCTYCTIHPASVEAFFARHSGAACALYAGKTCMDRNAPDGLRDTAQSAYDDSKRAAGAHGTASIGCPMSSRRAFHRPRRPSSWRRLARSGATIPSA